MSLLRIHHPSQYDPAHDGPRVGSDFVLAWGTCPGPVAEILGFLVNLQGKRTGTTHTFPRTAGPQGIWVVFFQGVAPADDYTLEIWTAKDGKTPVKFLGSLSPISVRPTYALQIAEPGSNTTVYAPQFMAGGSTDEYNHVTTTFTNGTATYHGTETHTPKAGEAYWMHVIGVQASDAGPGWTLSAVNETPTIATPSTGITLSI